MDTFSNIIVLKLENWSGYRQHLNTGQFNIISETLCPVFGCLGCVMFGGTIQNLNSRHVWVSAESGFPVLIFRATLYSIVYFSGGPFRNCDSFELQSRRDGSILRIPRSFSLEGFNSSFK